MTGKVLIYIGLIVMAVAIQHPLWLGKGGIERQQQLEEQLNRIRAENDALRARNNAEAAELESLETGSDAVAERARMKLGMIRQDEFFFQFIDKDQASRLAEEERLMPANGRYTLFTPRNSYKYKDGDQLPKPEGKTPVKKAKSRSLAE